MIFSLSSSVSSPSSVWFVTENAADLQKRTSPDQSRTSGPPPASKGDLTGDTLGLLRGVSTFARHRPRSLCNPCRSASGVPLTHRGVLHTVRIASFNVENFFARPKAMNQDTWAAGRPALAAFRGGSHLGHLSASSRGAAAASMTP